MLPLPLLCEIAVADVPEFEKAGREMVVRNDSCSECLCRIRPKASQYERLRSQEPVRDHAGLNDQNPNQIQYGNIGGVVDNNAPQEADTTQKPPKIRKPAGVLFLRRFDSLATELRMEGQSRTERRRDHRGRHGAQRFQNDYPFLQNNVGSAMLGNMGWRFGSARFLSETPI